MLILKNATDDHNKKHATKQEKSTTKPQEKQLLRNSKLKNLGWEVTVILEGLRISKGSSIPV